MNRYKLGLLFALAMMFVLSACGPTPQELNATVTVIAKTFIAEQTQNAPPTLTPSSTPNPTITSTTTATPEPKIYTIGECMSVEIPPSAGVPIKWEFKECVESVTVLPDGSMQVNFIWEYLKLDNGKLPDHFCLVKGPDYENKNMYMVDDLGNRYDHTDGGGYIAKGVLCEGDDYGSTSDFFLFPPVNPDASFLIFYDDDQGLQTAPFDVMWQD